MNCIFTSILTIKIFYAIKNSIENGIIFQIIFFQKIPTKNTNISIKTLKSWHFGKSNCSQKICRFVNMLNLLKNFDVFNQHRSHEPNSIDSDLFHDFLTFSRDYHDKLATSYDIIAEFLKFERFPKKIN